MNVGYLKLSKKAPVAAKMPEKLPFVGDYRIVGRMGEGTFSEVLKCQSMLDGKLYACKKMKQKYDNMEQVDSLREIQALRRLNPHPNVINLKEVVFDRPTGTLSLICELMDMNIYELIKDRRSYLPESQVKLYMYQLCKSIYHMHRNGIFHRDVKPENILIKGDVLKLADYGSCKSMYSKQPFTEYISTRWYRAPECLLTDGHYAHKMDIWSVGCVLYEIMSLRPLFPGSNEIDQIARIHEVVGSPSPQILSKFRKIQSRSMDFNFPYKPATGVAPLLKHGSRQCIELITKMCTYDPDERISAKEALRHPYFKELREAERKAKQEQQMRLDQSAAKLGDSRSKKHQPTQYRRPKRKDDSYAIKPRQYYMPHPPPGNISKLSQTSTLPQIASKPYLHQNPHPQAYASGLSTGLPSLTHSLAPSQISTFPPSIYSNEYGKYPSARHQGNSVSHLPTIPKHSFNTLLQRTNME